MLYQKPLENGKVQCQICPRFCTLNEGQQGFCFVRQNVDGKIVSTTYGYNTGLAIDPIEKKPLYHFYPRSSVLSFGTNGCNMGCGFCQNWHITKNKIDVLLLNKTSPCEIVEIAKKYNCKSVAFTYNDPIVFWEYAKDTAILCQKEDIKTVAVTSGFMNLELAKDFFNCIDAVNIDLKAFSEEFYRKNCLASLKPVLDVIKYVANETDCHLELTTMLIEGENDSKQELESQCDWIIKNLGDSVPLHFSAFFPKYKFMNRKSTDFSVLSNARKIAIDKGLKYVYTGNLSNVETSSTYCKNCSKPIIVRNGYEVVQYNLNGENCAFCGTKCDGFFDCM